MENLDPRWVGVGVERCVSLPAGLVFDTLIDIAALPMWAHDVEEVLDVPERLEPGVSWRTRKARNVSRRRESRSILLTFDPIARRMSHHTCAAPGDTSYREWRWECFTAATGCHVRVGWADRWDGGRVPFVGTPAPHWLERRRMAGALERLERLAAGRAVSLTRVAEPAGTTDVVIAG